MFLSIIIPVYKVEPYLRECLDSIAASELDCWEAILVDDGSPDGCPQICDEFVAKDKRFRVIHQENAGVAVARNAGIDVARGEWIWFVDSDDLVDMRPVGDMVTWLQEHHDADLVMFDLNTFKDNESDIKEVRVKVNVSVEGDVDVPIDKNKFLLENVIFHHQRLWYRRELLNRHEIRFTKGVRLAEDLELQYKYLTLCQHPAKFDNVVYYYREREGSATQNDTYRAKAVEDLQIVLNNLVDWIRKHDVKPESWLDLRVMKLFQNLLYSASFNENLNANANLKGNLRMNDNNSEEDKKNISSEENVRVKVNVKVKQSFQQLMREILEEYRRLGFPFVKKLKYRLADRNILVYFLMNKIYLWFKGFNKSNS